MIFFDKPSDRIFFAKDRPTACGPLTPTTRARSPAGRSVGPTGAVFSSGGTKVLFRFGAAAGLRICVTEAAIDALSLAAIEGLRDGTIYLSTGGGWSPNTETSLRHLLRQPSAQLIAATDANSQGETFADRLRALTDELDRDWLRLRPTADDWNEVLKQRGG